MNRRLALHRSRKGASPLPVAQGQTHSPAASRAAEAAARVAARYAKAPSYSQMQAEEARVAVRAAEIATQVALEAQAAAETVLAELHAATVEPPSRGPAVVESIARTPRKEAPAPAAAPEQPEVQAPPEPATEEPAPAISASQPAAAPEADPDPFFTPAPEGQGFGVRWEPDMPVRAMERKPAPARTQQEFELAAEDWWTPAEVAATLRDEPIVVADSEPAHANLIEFPRELVAARKMRPRMSETPGAALSEPDGQLSIFEVDPRSVVTEAEPLAPMREPSAGTWNGPVWSGMELEAQQPSEERIVLPEDIVPAQQKPVLASIGLRLMATAVDGTLAAAVFLVLAYALLSHGGQLLAPKTAEIAAVLGLAFTSLAYHMFFFSVATRTPGMKYAGIELRTFEDRAPDPAQLQRRLGAMLLSLLPLGLGLVWSVFDEDHLTWHDRISRTYLRKR